MVEASEGACAAAIGCGACNALGSEAFDRIPTRDSIKFLKLLFFCQ